MIQDYERKDMWVAYFLLLAELEEIIHLVSEDLVHAEDALATACAERGMEAGDTCVKPSR